MNGEITRSAEPNGEGTLPEDQGQSVRTEHASPVDDVVGLHLKRGREAKKMSVVEVGRMLKLSARQVEALEVDDWANLPCATIIRGFVRNYARLVDIDPQPLMSVLDRTRLPEAPQLELPSGTPVRMDEEKRVDRRDLARIVAGGVLLAGALAAYFLVSPDWLKATLETFKAATQSKPSVVEPTVTVRDKAPGSERTLPEVQPAVPVPTAMPMGMVGGVDAAAPSSAPEATPPRGGETSVPGAVSANTLRFAFTQPSWVEVRDKSGNIVFSQLNPGGTQKEVEGTPPFSVVIGNAAFVTLTYKGQSIDISRRSKDDVARLTVE